MNSRAISLSWSPPPASGTNGVIREYRINVTEVETQRVFTLTSTTTSIAIQSLHPYYTYSCVVSAYTVGYGPYTTVFNITTPEDGECELPMHNPVYQVVTSNSADWISSKLLCECHIFSLSTPDMGSTRGSREKWNCDRVHHQCLCSGDRGRVSTDFSDYIHHCYFSETIHNISVCHICQHECGNGTIQYCVHCSYSRGW